MLIQVENINDNSVKENVNVCYDNCGNIYLKHNEDYYFLMIGENDTIIIQQSHNMKKLLGNAKEMKLKLLKNSNDEKSLKGKILNKLDKSTQENSDTESESDGEETEYERNDRFFPEQKYYYHEITEDDENLYEDEQNFNCYSSGDVGILQYLDTNLNSYANYDTIVMNSHTKIVEMSLESSEANAYILIIYTNGQIDLNVVGSRRKVFKLTYQQNTITDMSEEHDNILFIANCVNIITV